MSFDQSVLFEKRPENLSPLAVLLPNLFCFRNKKGKIGALTEHSEPFCPVFVSAL